MKVAAPDDGPDETSPDTPDDGPDETSPDTPDDEMTPDTTDVVTSLAEVNKSGIWQRVKTDQRYRGRFIYTLCIYWSVVGTGWCYGTAGPTFPDLRQIVRQDLDTGAWLFTSGSIGYLLGTVMGGLLYGRFNRLLLLGISTAIAGIAMGLKPWCTSFPVMIVIGVIGTGSIGVVEIGANAEMVAVWEGEEGSMYMQALHFFYACGGIVSPLVAQPFLAPRMCVPYPEAGLTDNQTDAVLYGMVNNDSITNNTTPCLETFGETKVHIPFLIAGITMASSCLPFIYMYMHSDRNKKSVHDKEPTTDGPAKLSVKQKILLLFLLCGFLLFYCGVEDSSIGFLMTYCLRHLGWSKDSGSYASSAFWITFSTGRFLGIFLAKRFSSVCLLFTFVSSVVVSFTGLLISSMTLPEILPWIFIPMAGFSMSLVFACVFTWTETEIMKVSGMIASVIMVASVCSGMVNPLLFGYMMDNFSSAWYVYLLLGESVTALLFLTAIKITLSSCVTDTQQVREEDREQEMTFISKPPEAETK